MDLEAEFKRARRSIEARHVTWLKDQGVPMAGLMGEDGFAFGVLAIEVQTDGSWMPMPGGREAVILRDYPSPSADLDDLLAFFPPSPAQAFRRMGSPKAFPIVGAEAIEKAATLEQPLYVWGSLLDWMRAGYEGCVIVSWGGDLRQRFRGVNEVRCPSQKFGQQLREALTKPYPCPTITAPT